MIGNSANSLYLDASHPGNFLSFNMDNIFVKPGLLISESGSKILSEMLKDVPEDTATATIEVTKDGTTTVAAAARIRLGENNDGWMIGVGAYHKKEKSGDTVKGAGISISW